MGGINLGRRWTGGGFACMRIAMVAVLLVFASTAATAQSVIDRPRAATTVDRGPIDDALKTDIDPPGSTADGGADSAARAAASPELLKAIDELRLAQVRRELQKLREIERELWWTNWIGRVIFVVVQVILVVGLVVAWMEFRSARSQRQAAAEQPSEIRVSLEGVALKSSLHGILILSLALAFYLLYLRYVFPVTTIGS